jgi:hypothetical protein
LHYPPQSVVPTLFPERLAQLCALWLAVFIVSAPATLPSSAAWDGQRLTAPCLQPTRTPHHPARPAPAVAPRAVLTEAGDETRLMPSPAALTIELPRPRRTPAHPAVVSGGAARGDARPPVLVLRV